MHHKLSKPLRIILPGCEIEHMLDPLFVTLSGEDYNEPFTVEVRVGTVFVEAWAPLSN